MDISQTQVLKPVCHTDGLSNLEMKPNESTGERLGQITNTVVIIKESYAAYRNKVPAPNIDANGGYLDAMATKWRNNSVNNTFRSSKCNSSGQPFQAKSSM